MTPHRLDGRTAIITGASQGLGRAIAQAYVAAGASVLVCARDGALVERVAAEIGAGLPQGRVHAMRADVARTADVDALVARALELFGRIDILVNNAGGYGPKGPIDEVDWSEWVRAVETNLLGAAYCCRAVLPHMRRQGGGKIVNLSGGAATQPIPNLSAYGASKAGLIRFMETLAHELAPLRIDVNAIAPGPLNTRMLDEVLAAGPERVGEAFYRKALQQKASGGAPLERGAALAVFLGSAASDGITGRLLSAIWDRWETLEERRGDLAPTDIYTLRRVGARERGKEWDA